MVSIVRAIAANEREDFRFQCRQRRYIKATIWASIDTFAECHLAYIPHISFFISRIKKGPALLFRLLKRIGGKLHAQRISPVPIK